MNNGKYEDKSIANSSDHATGMQGSSAIYADNVVFHAKQGHGFAAEKANHLADTLAGKNALIVGGNNAKNGADRLVDGQLIQTKYCKSGSACIAETIDPNTGLFKYIDNEGRPMQIEVPSDMYESAVKSMENRILKGQVPGETDPAAATRIVRKGRFTYKQAENVAKAGTVESLTYDALNGIKLAGAALGITALLTFAMEIWQGKSKADALDAACFSGICVGGIAWATCILTAQVGRTGAENALRASTDWAVKQLSPNVVNALANAFRNGNNISDQVARDHVSKLLRGQIAVTVVVTAVLSVDDFIALFSREISGTQAFKNICNTAAGVAGGSLGAWGGAAVGTMVAGPGVGTWVGSTVGAAAGGFLAGTAAKTGLDAAIDDDSVDIEKLMNSTFGELGSEYLLSEEETHTAIADFRTLDMAKTVRAIYAANDREAHTRAMMQPFFERVAAHRPPVFRPSKKKFAASTEKVLEQLAQTEPTTQAT